MTWATAGLGWPAVTPLMRDMEMGPAGLQQDYSRTTAELQQDYSRTTAAVSSSHTFTPE